MKEFSEIVTEVRAILLSDWDPIGISDVPNASNEYEQYVNAIAKLIQMGRPTSEIAGYLYDTEVHNMELSGDRNRAEFVAEKLHSVGTR